MVYEFDKEVRFKAKPYTFLGAVSDVIFKKLVSMIPGRKKYSFISNMMLRLQCYRDSQRLGWSIVTLYPDENDPGYHKII